MHTYSHLVEHPRSVDERIAIYGRVATGDRYPRPAVHFCVGQDVSRWNVSEREDIPPPSR
jgi:hypothetical protein